MLTLGSHEAWEPMKGTGGWTSNAAALPFPRPYPYRGSSCSSSGTKSVDGLVLAMPLEASVATVFDDSGKVALNTSDVVQLFSTHGYQLENPCFLLRLVHNHASGWYDSGTAAQIGHEVVPSSKLCCPTGGLGKGCRPACSDCPCQNVA